VADFEGRLACVIAANGKIARGHRIAECPRLGPGDYSICWLDDLRG